MKKLIISILLLAAFTAMAGTPQPAEIIYGRVRDAFGFPYADSGRIILSKGGVECARYDFGGMMTEGLKYRLTLDMDSGGTPYTSRAVQFGDVLTISVEVGGVAQPLIPTNRVVVGAPGSAVRLDLITGTDADGDGLPDEWELLLCEQSGGRLAGIAAVNPNDDFDGDGLSNIQEFNSGTCAFLATDLLAVGGWERASASRMKLRFLTSQGMSYRVIAKESLVTGAWYPVRFAGGESDPFTYSELVGNGNYQTIYIQSTAGALFVRLAAQQ
jgi:hypothetical protein